MRAPPAVIAALWVAACGACGDDGTHVRRSPGEPEPEPPPPAWCEGGKLAQALTGVPPAVLEPVPPRERATLCPRDTQPMTAQLDDAAPGMGTEVWCARDGARHGRWRSYWSDGSLQAEREFRDGAPHGYWRVWYPNGDPWLERRYLDGALHGTQVEYREGHQRRLELDFDRGRPAGRWRYWNTRGDVVCDRRP